MCAFVSLLLCILGFSFVKAILHVLCVRAYFAELSDASMCGLSSMLSVYSIFSEEQVDFVIFWVVTL